MAKIYVVITGEYSSMSIFGVFDKEHKDRADAFAALYGGAVEEHELNAPNEEVPNIPAGTKPCFVVMLKNGNVILVRSAPYHQEDALIGTTIFREAHGHFYMHTYMWAKDDQHAIKIANERRIQLIESHRWGISIGEVVTL